MGGVRAENVYLREQPLRKAFPQRPLQHKTVNARWPREIETAVRKERGRAKDSSMNVLIWGRTKTVECGGVSSVV